jgi:hypothetical protein
MPPNSLHILQPFGIGCFALLKRLFSRLVGNMMRLSVNHIDKLNFLATYPIACAEAPWSQNIQNSFAAAGLTPYNPEPVLT